MARRSEGRKTDYTWRAGAASFGTGVSLTATQAALNATGVAVVTASTLMRTRGEVIIEATPNAIGDTDVVGLGLIVVSMDVFGVGGTSLPGPLTDPRAPWLWHWYVNLEAASVALDGSHILTNRIIEIDSKAMRCMKETETIALVGQIFTGEFAVVSAVGAFRLLFGR